MQARYYDPVIGRFYSNDPVGYISENPVMSFNRYLYVNNNPYKYNDPNGEFLHLAVGFAIGAGAELISQAVQGKDLNFTKAAVSGVAGAVTGGVSALAKTSLTVGGKVIATAGEKALAGGLVASTGATAAAGGSAVNDSLEGASNGQIVDNAIEAAVESVLPHAKVVGKVASEIVQAVGKKLGIGETAVNAASEVTNAAAGNVLNDQCSATQNTC